MLETPEDFANRPHDEIRKELDALKQRYTDDPSIDNLIALNRALRLYADWLKKAGKW
jgi:hypothetical protein